MDKVKNIDEMPKKSPLSLQIDLKKFEKATEEEEKQKLQDKAYQEKAAQAIYKGIQSYLSQEK